MLHFPDADISAPHIGADAAAALSLAAHPAPDAAGFNSHEIHPDHTVTFRYKDATAAEVKLVLEGNLHPLPMHRTFDGTWTFTTPPLPPELYTYSFQVDGKNHADPDNPRSAATSTRSAASSTSPAPPPSPGILPMFPMASSITTPTPRRSSSACPTTRAITSSTPRPATIPRPPPPAQRLPVLFLLHGWSGRAESWTTTGQADLIFDNLIAQHRMQPMIVVMPLGYGDMAFVHNGHKVWDDPAKVQHNLDLFSDALLNEVMPQVEAGYFVSHKREDRAIAGLSMGGLEALTIGLTHPDRFAWVAGMSSASTTPTISGS